MSKYVPYPFFHDDVPVDISFVFADEKPAGKHGFLQVKGRDFVFEDGTPVKFWGTNFNGAGCFPEHDYAEKLARRLAKIGINLVRFHQLDSEWHTPNIFSFTRGERPTNGKLSPESMDRLDYLIYCLKKEGIYVYFDMMTYRKFRSDEGVENAHNLKDSAKPYSVFARKLIELQKDFCRDVWLHENPYTKLKYCDDPVIVLTEITNECDLFHAEHSGVDVEYIEPYKTEFLTYLDEWFKKNNINKNAYEVDYTCKTKDLDVIRFRIDLQSNYYREMMDCMHELGVKIPIAGTNWNSLPGNYETQLVCDFIDDHTYYYDWNWKVETKSCMNRGITQQKNSYLDICARYTHSDYPTYISEWDMPWPNEFRAESPIHAAAVGCYQGWSGFAIHTYSYSTRLERMNMLGKEISAEQIGGTPYRQGIFSAWNDPAKFGLFYHSALITRRGDVREAEKSYAIMNPDLTAWHDEELAANTERFGLLATVDNKDGRELLPKIEDTDDVMSDTGELYRNWVKNYGYVDTDMTKCVYGQLAKNGEMNLKGVKINCKTDFAVIAMSSLTKDPIFSSDNILLTTVGRAKNTDMKTDGELTLDLGKPPVLIECIEAEIEIDKSEGGFNVYAVSAEGYTITKANTVEEDGKLKFSIGNDTQSMYYIIAKS